MTVETTLGINTFVKPAMFLVSVILATRALYFTDKVSQVKTLVGLSLLANELFFLALPLLLLPKFFVQFNFFKRGNKLSVMNMGFFLYSILLLITTNIYGFSPFTILFWMLTFGFLFILFNFFSGRTYDSEEAQEIFHFFFKVIVVQLFIMVIQSFIHRNFKPGDFWTGSSGNAIVVGFYLCILMLYLFAQYVIKLDRYIPISSMFSWKNIMWLIVLAPFLYFNDSKVIIICFLVPCILYLLLLLVLRFLSTFRPVLLVRTVFAFVAIILILAATYVVSDIYVKMTMGTNQGLSSLRYYVTPTATTQGEVGKFILYQRVYNEMLEDYPVDWVVGVGPGKLGSRTSNLMGYNVLYKVEGQDKLPTAIKPYAHPLMEKYMADLWTKEIVATNKYRSATLSMPFAGLITLKAEYGIVGLIFYLFIIYSFSYLLIRKAFTIENWKLKNWAIALSITWFSFPFHMIFDNVQEKNYFMIPLLLLSAVIYSMKDSTSSSEK